MIDRFLLFQFTTSIARSLGFEYSIDSKIFRSSADLQPAFLLSNFWDFVIIR